MLLQAMDVGVPSLGFESLGVAEHIGQADAQQLYFGGKLEVSGNVVASNNLGPALEGMDPGLIEAAKAARLKS
ncbi:hypothetical protein HBA55_34000 [Pseudomaricurvus alkylphenolicus]|uniref:hypothetical protein n=1 Tax=Pseudomaricurvus alkylphenolicus TaxID=1306991 RepID=UPI001422A7CB|nr:hypothetical protein [Pseudomaricurvus alkylphenolicus]NIB44646.1 hypothetical protein [Pseudomaricurvus alkylphenolicus]